MASRPGTFDPSSWAARPPVYPSLCLTPAPHGPFLQLLTQQLAQQLAQQLDVELMSVQGGFALEQLMELAGLGVAEAVVHLYGAAPRLLR